MMLRSAAAAVSALKRSFAADRFMVARAFCAGSERQKGTVKWFDRTKGWGFIVPSGEAAVNGPNEHDIFVHYSEVREPAPLPTRAARGRRSAAPTPAPARERARPAMKTSASWAYIPTRSLWQMKICADFPLSRDRGAPRRGRGRGVLRRP